MKKVILLSVFMVLGLVLFTGRASIAGEITDDSTDDSTITAQVNRAITEDPDSQYFKIDVTTIRGYVTLQGFVNGKETEKRVLAKVRDIRGVKSVTSLLTVEEKK